MATRSLLMRVRGGMRAAPALLKAGSRFVPMYRIWAPAQRDKARVEVAMLSRASCEEPGISGASWASWCV